MNCKQLFFTALAICLSTSYTFSQELENDGKVIRTRSDFKRGVNIYAVIPAFTISSSANINAVLMENGYPTLPKGHLNYGFGFMYRVNRLLMGADMFWGNQIRSFPEPERAIMKRNPWTYSFNIGYHVFKGDGFALYPIVGVSYTDTNLFLSKTTSSSALNDILATPGNSVNLFHESAGIFLGLAFDMHWLFRKDSPLVALKVGKIIQVDDSFPWESFYTPLSNSVVDNFNYWQIQLNMGGVFNWDKKRRN